MTKTRFYLLSAASMLGICSKGHAYPLTIPLPPQAIPALPPNPSIPVLLGSWHDGPCLLLPPGVTPFEAVSDTITFRQDGTFTQDINKATGRLKETGTFAVTGNRLTLSYWGTLKPEVYEFSRKGNTLFLQPVGSGKPTFALERGRS